MEVSPHKKNTRVKGSYHYLHSCGRQDQKFFPFSGVPTTLKVGKALDKIYDVRHEYSSKHKRSRTPRLVDKTGTKKVLLRSSTPKKETIVPEGPDCCTYDPLKAMKEVKQRGRIDIRISAAKRMDEALSPVQREEKAKEYEDMQKTLHTREKSNEPVQRMNKAVKHVPGVDFSKHHPHPSLQPRPPSPPATPVSAETSASPIPAVLSAPPPVAIHHRPSTPPGGMFGQKRKTLDSYSWNPSSYPAAGRAIEFQDKISYRAQDRHTPRVSMGRASGRERDNRSKDNCEALERIMKKVNRQQAVRDKKASFVEEDRQSTFKKCRGVDIWLSGGRMGMAVQGYCEGSDNARSAAWVANEAQSINRRVKNEMHVNEPARERGKKGAKLKPSTPAPALVEHATELETPSEPSPMAADAADIAVDFEE